MKRPGIKLVGAAIFVVALILAGIVSFYAANSPDGLTKVSEDKGFASSQRTHGAQDGPFAGYGTSFIDNDRLSGGVAGVVGVLVVLALGSGLTLAVRRKRSDESDEGGAQSELAASGPSST